MLYTFEELKRWWDSLTTYDKERIFEIIQDDLDYQDFGSSLETLWKKGIPFTMKQLAALRKWSP